MAKNLKKSSLLSKYSRLYEKNPKSRVFAPLAEAYRKLGMLDEAFQVLRKGIKLHPTYVMGYNVLAHCYFDKENYELAYTTIRPFVSQNLDNISLQKLFAQVCVNLGYLEEALQTFKYLLLINPKDAFVSEQVKLLEDDLMVEEATEPKAFETSEGFGEDEDEWVQVDFNRSENEENVDDLQEWNMEAPVKRKLSDFAEDIKKQNLDIEEHSLDDDYYFEEYDDEEAGMEPQEGDETGESAEPIITHTLVDLYIRQGHLDKAAKLLESILELHPEDKPSLTKLESLKEELAKNAAEPVAQEEAPDLANLVQEKIRTGRDRSRKTLENKLNIFLLKLKKEAELRQERA